jgi:hypothetical protein
VVALLLGAAQAAQAPLGLPPVLAAAGPAYIHLLVVGWITQMIFGVAYWMFPRYSDARPRGHDGLAIATLVLLNVGLVLRVLVEPVQAVYPDPGRGPWLVAAALAQWLAAVGFILNTWPRVKAK